MAELNELNFERLYKKLAADQDKSIRETVKNVSSSQEARSKAFERQFEKQTNLVQNYLNQTGKQFTDYGKEFQSSIERLSADTAKQSSFALKLQKRQINQLEKEAEMDFLDRRISKQEHEAFMMQLESIKNYQKENGSFLKGATEGIKNAILQNIDMISIATGILGDSPLIGIATKLGLEAFKSIKERKQKREEEKQLRKEKRRDYGPGGKKVELIPLAAGGIVMGPTPALVGEAGPEAVIPLSELDKALQGNVYENPFDKITAQSTQELVSQSKESFLLDFANFKSPGGALALLSTIAAGIQGIPLSFKQRFADFFTNFGGLFPSRAARKRQEKSAEKQKFRDSLQELSIDYQRQQVELLSELLGYFYEESDKDRELRLEEMRAQRAQRGISSADVVPSRDKTKTNKITKFLNDPLDSILEYGGTALASALGFGAAGAGAKGISSLKAAVPAGAAAAPKAAVPAATRMSGIKGGGKLGALSGLATTATIYSSRVGFEAKNLGKIATDSVIGKKTISAVQFVMSSIGKVLKPFEFLLAPFKKIKIDAIAQFTGKGLFGAVSKVLGVLGIFDIFKAFTTGFDTGGEGISGLLKGLKESLTVAFEFFNLPMFIANFTSEMLVKMFGTEDVKQYFDKFAKNALGNFSLITLAENMIIDIFDSEDGALMQAVRAIFTKENFMALMTGTGSILDSTIGAAKEFIQDLFVDIIDFFGFSDFATNLQKSYDAQPTFTQIYEKIGEVLINTVDNFINTIVESELFKTIKSYFDPGTVLGDFFAKIKKVVTDYFGFKMAEYDMTSSLEELRQGDEAVRQQSLKERLALIDQGKIEERGTGAFSREGIKKELAELEFQKQRNFLESLSILDTDYFNKDDITQQQLYEVLQRSSKERQELIFNALKAVSKDTDINPADLQFIASITGGTSSQMLASLNAKFNSNLNPQGGTNVVYTDQSQVVNNNGSMAPASYTPTPSDPYRGDVKVDG